MPSFQPGLVHTPVTPFKRDQSIDFDAYGKLIEFHLRHGADALALPMPPGEDLSLTDSELRTLLEFAPRWERPRVGAGTSTMWALTSVARVWHAEQAGRQSCRIRVFFSEGEHGVEHIVRVGPRSARPYCSPPVEDRVTR